MNNISNKIWIKKYLMNNPVTRFYEARYLKNYVIVNCNNMNITGCHFSHGNFDYDNDIKAIYEYIERLACYKAPKSVTKEDEEEVLLLKQLGFGWTGIEFLSLKNRIKLVEGYSARDRRKVMVPSVFAYYLDNDLKDWSNFFGNSNGNALGICEEDAMERGILEFIERDKFIKYWYLGDGKLYKISERNLSPALRRKVYFFKKKSIT